MSYTDQITQEDRAMSELKPCPFCGEQPEIHKHFKEEMWNLIHRCKVIGPITIDWDDKDRILNIWNTRPDLKARLVEAINNKRFRIEDGDDMAYDKGLDDAIEAINTIMGEQE